MSATREDYPVPNTDSPTPNVPLLRQTMDAILAHPEKHDQSWWATQTDCGTAYCFAGWACVLTGETIKVTSFTRFQTETELGQHIGRLATVRLGLDSDTAEELFEPRNTTADLKHYVDQIAEHGRIVEPIERGE